MVLDLTDEERELKRRAQEFGQEHIEPVAMDYVKSRTWPQAVFERAAEAGFIGLGIEGEHTNGVNSLLAQCIVDEEFCRANSSVGCALNSATAGCYVVSEFGTDEQRRRWVEPVMAGEAVSAIGMTEPNTGSSLSNISTMADRNGDEYVLNGTKRWISNGDGDWVATLCRTDEEAHVSDALSIIVVPTETEGFSAEPIDTMGLTAMEQVEITFDGVRVPVENRLGSQEGDGFRQVMTWLSRGHGRISMGAVNLGMARGAFDRALTYASDREQGGQPIGEYQGIRWKLANMRMKLEVAQSQVHRAARLVDTDADQSVITEQASIAKLFATEAACDVASEAVQILGANGYAKDYGIEHIYRDVRAGTLYEGTSEILRNTIGQAIFDEL